MALRHVATLLASLVVSSLLATGPTPTPTTATGACTTGLTLQLQPGLPGAIPQAWVTPAADIPAGPFYVSLPVYPGAHRLPRVQNNPMESYPATPYLHSGLAEYRVSENADDVSFWYSDHLAACGWKPDGSWNTDGIVFTNGIVFSSRSNPHLQVQLAFGATSHGDTLIGYTVLDETLPLRPIASYLHGPFSRLNIAYELSPSAHPGQEAHLIHLPITNPAAIHQLVTRINSLTDILGGVRSEVSGGRERPAWLTFIRHNGRHIGVFDTFVGLQVKTHANTLRRGPRVVPDYPAGEAVPQPARLPTSPARYRVPRLDRRPRRLPRQLRSIR